MRSRRWNRLRRHVIAALGDLSAERTGDTDDEPLRTNVAKVLEDEEKVERDRKQKEKAEVEKQKRER